MFRNGGIVFLNRKKKEGSLLNQPGIRNTLVALDSEFGKLAIELAGRVWARPGLTQKERAFLCLAANVCNQTVDGPFQIHLDMALKAGATPKEIREVLLHMAIYASFPKTLTAMKAFHKHLEERGIEL